MKVTHITPKEAKILLQKLLCVAKIASMQTILVVWIIRQFNAFFL